MKYQVFDNGKPADCHHHKVDASWANSTFSLAAEAVDYACKWLNWESVMGVLLEVNKPYDYSGYGDFIEIRRIEDAA